MIIKLTNGDFESTLQQQTKKKKSPKSSNVNSEKYGFHVTLYIVQLLKYARK